MISGSVRSYAVSTKLGDELGGGSLELDLANLNGQSELPLARVLSYINANWERIRYDSEISDVAREETRRMRDSPSISTIPGLCAQRKRSAEVNDPGPKDRHGSESSPIAGPFKFHRCLKKRVPKRQLGRE